MKTKHFAPVDGDAITVVFGDYTGYKDKDTLCTYCILRQQCEIFQSNAALERTFSIRTQIVECPRMIEEPENE
jgi:hypothetical protein